MTDAPASRTPGFWLGSFIIWFLVLWVLSSRSGDMREMPAIPFHDKIAHFGYFAGGGGLLSAFLYTRRRERPVWPAVALAVFLILGLVGAVDEYHQTFTPGRNGADPFDWLADITGAMAGMLVLKRLRHWIGG